MKFFITTAIDYVNSLPHIGTAYEKVGADILARFHRLLGDEVLFQMGNDEHSVNVKKAAIKEGVLPKVYCDKMKPLFENVWKKLNISYDQFVQTSSPRHHKAVAKLFDLIDKKGDIYEGDYEGLYCESCEAFYTEKDLTDGCCPQHKSRPRSIKEKNFFFRLSKYAPALLDHVNRHPEFILPERRRNEMINVIKGGLKDVSVSRAGLDWGIPLPIKKGHVVYVWFDALINYLTLIGFADHEDHFKKWWPADCHVIGKDITRFHCIIWPAMLLSSGLPLPKTIIGHGFVFLKGEKMSKSLGHVVTPLDVVDQFGADSLRYYLMRTASFGEDGNFTWEDFINRYNSDLANGLGNTVSRTVGMIQRYFKGKLSPVHLSGEDAKLSERYEDTLQVVKTCLDYQQSGDALFHRALEHLWGWLAELDRYIDREAPWTLAKQKKQGRLTEVLTALSKSLFYLTILINPFMPETSEKIWHTLGWNKRGSISQEGFQTKWDDSCIVEVHPESKPLFSRIETSSDK